MPPHSAFPWSWRNVCLISQHPKLPLHRILREVRWQEFVTTLPQWGAPPMVTYSNSQQAPGYTPPFLNLRPCGVLAGISTGLLALSCGDGTGSAVLSLETLGVFLNPNILRISSGISQLRAVLLPTQNYFTSTADTKNPNQFV